MPTGITILKRISGGKRNESHHVQLSAADIRYMTGDGNYTKIHLASGEVVIMSVTLKEYERRLPGFIRIHKQTMVNPAHIARFHYRTREDSLVIMQDDTSFLVSRRRRSAIWKQWTDYKFPEYDFAD